MEKIDRDISQLAVFKTSSGNGKDLDLDDMDYGDENAAESSNRAVHPLSPKSAALSKSKPRKDQAGKFKGISSVSQLKHLLRNYDALVEGQHHLLT